MNAELKTSTALAVLPSKEVVAARAQDNGSAKRQVKDILARHYDDARIVRFLQSTANDNAVEGSLLADDFALTFAVREIAEAEGNKFVSKIDARRLKNLIASARKSLGVSRKDLTTPQAAE